MAWTTDLTNDPFRDRFIVGISGYPGTGKTTALLELAKVGKFVFLISMDGGTSKVRTNPAPYKGKLAINYIAPTAPNADGSPWSFKKELEDSARTLVGEKIPFLMSKGVKRSDIWVGIDTATHMQARLMNEVREMEIEYPDQKQTYGNKKKGRNTEEFLTQLDFNINAGMMTSITEMFYRANCNIVVISLVKHEEVNDKLKRAVPAIQGSSYQKITGDADVWLYLENGPQGRVFRTKAGMRWEAKDRFDVLDESIPFTPIGPENKVPTLLKIRNKVFTTAAVAEETKENANG